MAGQSLPPVGTRSPGGDDFWSYIKYTLQPNTTYYIEVSSHTAGDDFEYRLQFDPGVLATEWIPPVVAVPVVLYEVATDYPVNNNGLNRNLGGEGNGDFIVGPDGWTIASEPPLGMVVGFTFQAIISNIPVVKFDGVPIAQVSRWDGWTLPLNFPHIWNDYSVQSNGRTLFRVNFGPTDPTLITFEWTDPTMATTIVEWSKLPLVTNAELVNYTDADPSDMIFVGGSIRLTGRNLTGVAFGVGSGPFADLGGASWMTVTGTDTVVDVGWGGTHDFTGYPGLLTFKMAWDYDVLYGTRPKIFGFVGGWRFKNVNAWPPWPPSAVTTMAVGTTGAITADHAATWAALPNLPAGIWNTGDYGLGTWVIGGRNQAAEAAMFAYSTDNGVSWTSHSWDGGIAADHEVISIAFGNGRFVAVGQIYTAVGGNKLPCAWTSLNGISWTAPILLPNNIGNNGWGIDGLEHTGVSATYVLWFEATQRFIAVIGDPNRAAGAFFSRSADGLTWTTALAPDVYLDPGLGYLWGGFATSGTSLIWLSNNGIPWRSTDGITWTLATRTTSLPVDVFITGQLAYGNGRYFWLGTFDKPAYYSNDDGLTWYVGSAIPPNTHALGNLIFDSAFFIGTGSGSDDGWVTTYMTSGRSANGVAWTEKNEVLPDSAWALVTSSGISGTAPVLTSISIAPSPVTLALDSKRPFTVTGHYSNGSTVPLTSGLTFTSSAPAVASINGSGVATALTVGTTTVQVAHAASGFEATSAVTTFLPTSQSIAVGANWGENPALFKTYRTFDHGATWTEYGVLSFTSVSYTAAVYGAGTFVIAGFATGNIATDGVYFLSSQDGGATWSSHRWAPPLLANEVAYGDVWSIDYGNGRFVAVGETRVQGQSTGLPCSWVSLDGITWSDAHVIPNPSGNNNWALGNPTFAVASQIVWAPSASKFIAVVGDSNVLGTVYTASSADGVTWTTVAVTADRGPDYSPYVGLAASPSTIVLLAYDGVPFTSTNGTAWTSRAAGNTPPAGIEVYYLGYGGGKFLYPGNGTLHEYYSTNEGVTWQVGNGALLEGSFEYSSLVSYDGTTFLQGGGGTEDAGFTYYPKFARSTTGLAWTEVLYPTMTVGYFITLLVSNKL